MSSRSPSPPRRTVINGSKTEDGGDTQIEELVKMRNQKLIELYCVSRMGELLNITDEAYLKTELSSFLAENDIRKGTRFQSSTLPKSEAVEHNKNPALENKKVPVKEKASSTPIPSNGAGMQQLQVSSSNDSSTPSTVTSTANNNNINKRPFPEFDAYQEKRVKLTSERSAPAYPVPPTSQIPHPMYYMDVNVPPAKPTPVEPTYRYQNRLVDEVTRPPVEEGSYFHENNINSRESVYLLTKDIVPSKIAQALPLAELKYMVQTLPLIKLIPMAHKALTTDIMNNALNEGRITVVSSRIEELRRLGLWSLRQPKPFVDPWENEPSHHRTLMAEAKWMQTDFKEGQAYKIAVCTTLAQAVMDYWIYGEACCVKRASTEQSPVNNGLTKLHGIEQGSSTTDKETSEPNQSQIAEERESDMTKTAPDTLVRETIEGPDLVQSSDDSIGKDSQGIMKGSDNDAEDDQFLLPKPGSSGEGAEELNDEVSGDAKSLQKSVTDPYRLTLSFDELRPLEQTILQDAPLYIGTNSEDTRNGGLPFVPISKSMITLEDDHYLKIVERQIMDEEQSLVQLSKRRGMFYGNRRSHYLKPPPAPSLRYLQNRTPTIWLPEDDQELVRNINAYAYNWELISAHMSSRPSMSYVSNIERRTPWQCFERFVQLNEKFSFNDLKGPRAHSVQQWLMEAHKFQQRQNRRISPLGVGQESIQRGHRRLRWASMFEAMRKCIKKRENAPRPNPTQPRKPLDCKNMKVPTPAEMSQLKAQRDEALRRDIQLRRSFKNRIQQQQQQQLQQHRQQTPQQASQANVNIGTIKANSTSRMNTSPDKPHSNSGSTPQAAKTPTNRHTPLQRKLTEQEIIEGYSKKILAKQPEFSLETAMNAAQRYYRSLVARQQEHQRQQQGQQTEQPDPKQSPSQQHGPSQSEPKSSKSSSNSSNTINGSNSQPDPNNKIKSPTPQEILRKYQK